jgi:acetate kinase
MEGLDVVVWTGGVDEHALTIRAAAADGLGSLGVRIDHESNRGATGDQDLTADGATVQALVVTARENLEIVRQVRGVLS